MRPAAWRAYCALAGAGDALTGLALIAAPATVLALLGIDAGGADAVFLRYIGTFVAGVGALYLYPLLLGAEGWQRRLRPVLESTALLRGGVALFLAAGVSAGSLPAAWLSVAGVDGALALFQAVSLRGALDG